MAVGNGDNKGLDVLHIGQFVTEREIGHGAMGVVYAARRTTDGSRIALKTLQVDQIGESAELAVARFNREVQAVTSLHHPGIVRVHESGQADVAGLGKVLYYAMELISGETLHQSLKRGPFFPSEAVAIVIKVADALHFAHGHGIVHRDIKPANVFLTPDNRVVIADFGVCKFTNLRTLTTAGSLIGTIPFLAPEQLLDQPVDARSDIFSLGALLYTLVTKRYLRPTSSVPALLQSVNSDVDAAKVRAMVGFESELVEVIAKAVARDPARRYQKATELIGSLWPLAGALPKPGPERVAAKLDITQVTSLKDAGDEVATRDSDPPLSTDADIAPTAPGAAAHRSTPPRPAPPTSLPAPTSGVFAPPAHDAPSPFRRQSKPSLPAATTTDGDQDELLELDLPPAPPPEGSAPLVFAPPPYSPANPRRKKELRHVTRGATSAETIEATGWRAQLGRWFEPAWVKLVVAAALAGLLLLLVWLVLRSGSVDIAVDTLPPGANAAFNGEPAGPTPVVRAVARRKGSVLIELTADGRDTYRTTLALPLFGRPRPLVVAMPFRRASLKLTTRPPAASVVVDGKPSCTTPCEAGALAPLERHWIAVDREGCTPTLQLFQAQPGEAATQEIALKPLQPSSLTMLAVWFDRGPVLVDDQDMTEALTNNELLLYAGPHWLKVGDEPEQALQLPPAGTRLVDVRKQRRPPDRPKLTEAADGLQLQTGGVSSFEANLRYAIYQLSEGRAKLARPFLMQALLRDGNNPRVHRALIVSAAAAGNTKLALGHMNAFVSMQISRADDERVRRVLIGGAKPGICVDETVTPAP